MVNKALKQELDHDLATKKKYLERLNVLKHIEQIIAPTVDHKKLKINCHVPTFAQLQDVYQEQVYDLNKKHPEATEKTHAELIVAARIAQVTKLKGYKSFWIANRNIDLFFPTVGQLHTRNFKGKEVSRPFVMRGLAIEVDGAVHNNELKMRKDESKGALLSSLGIGHIVVNNTDTSNSTVQKLFRQLKNAAKLDTRAKQRVLRKIYVVTLAYHASEKLMARLYGEQFAELVHQGGSCHE